jgi:hypothetical protein
VLKIKSTKDSNPKQGTLDQTVADVVHSIMKLEALWNLIQSKGHQIK